MSGHSATLASVVKMSTSCSSISVSFAICSGRMGYTVSVKVLEFIGANLFFLALTLVGAGAMLALGTLINRFLPNPDEQYVAWSAALFASIACVYFAAKWGHRAIQAYLTSRSRSGARAGSVRPGSHQ